MHCLNLGARILRFPSYEGTRLGRQELNAEILDDVPGALWNRARIEDTRWPAHRNVPELIRIVIAIDPAVSSGDEADETGIIVAGIDANNHGYVLADQSGRYPPTEWARIAIRVYRQYNANRIAVYPVALNFEQAVQARITTLADRHAPCPNAVPH